MITTLAQQSNTTSFRNGRLRRGILKVGYKLLALYDTKNYGRGPIPLCIESVTFALLSLWPPVRRYACFLKIR